MPNVSSPSLRRALPVPPPSGMKPALEPLYWTLRKEKRSPAVRDPAYLFRAQKHGMTRSWRRKICRWMFQTAKEFDLEMDSVANAMHFMDQFLSRTSVDRTGLQLLGMVCLWVATKLHEARPILIAEMAIMCEHKFSRQDMLDTEQQLSAVIQFHFSPPNPFSFARDFASRLPLAKDEQKRSAFLASVFHLLELSLEDIVSVGCDASSLALAAVQLVAENEWGIPADKLTTEVLLEAISIEISPAALSKATSLLRVVYQRHPSLLDESPEASVTSSPTAVEEAFDYIPENDEITASELEGDDADSSLLADESESLFASDSESLSPQRERLTRPRDESDYDLTDNEKDGGKRRRTA